MKILLLTDVPPCKEFTGGLVLTRLCGFLPEGSIACFSVQTPSLAHIKMTPELESIPIEYAVKPQENTPLHRIKLRMALESFLRDNYNSAVALRPIVQQGVDFGRRFGADLVWSVLQGPSMIRLARRVAQGLGVPLVTLIADPPDWWLLANRFDGFSTAKVLQEYAEVIRQSARCGTASWAMAEEYQQKYTTPCIPLVPSIDVRLSVPPNSVQPAKNKLTIGLAGQIYAQTEWNALLTALDSVNWNIAGHDIKIKVMAQLDVQRLIPTKNVEMLGWFPQDQAIQMLSQNDVNYCPYRFGPEFEEETRLCFPSKLTSYLAAGKPVLFHGPKNSSPAIFLRKYDAGALAYSLEPSEIIQALTRLVTDPDFYQRVATNGYNAYIENLTLTTYRKQFAAFLGVNDGWLTEIP